LTLFFSFTCLLWGTYLFLIKQPTYMKEVLHFDIKSNGLLSAVPYVAFFLFIILSSIVADKLVNRKIMTRTATRKLMNGLGIFVPMICVLLLTRVECDRPYLAVALLTVALAFTGCCYGAGILVNFNDLCGPYAGIVFGIGNTFASIPGFVAPSLVGYLTPNKTHEEWNIVFYITAAIYFIGGVVSVIFTSGELEPWAKKERRPSAGVVLMSHDLQKQRVLSGKEDGEQATGAGVLLLDEQQRK